MFFCFVFVVLLLFSICYFFVLICESIIKSFFSSLMMCLIKGRGEKKRREVICIKLFREIQSFICANIYIHSLLFFLYVLTCSFLRIYYNCLWWQQNWVNQKKIRHNYSSVLLSENMFSPHTIQTSDISTKTRTI